MKYFISKLNRTVDLDDMLVQEFCKYDTLRDSIFTVLLRTKYHNNLSGSNVSNEELSSACNKILLDELKIIGGLPAIIQTYIDNIETFKNAAITNQCIEEKN